MACLAAAFAVRLGWLALEDPAPAADSEWYYLAAQQIAAGNGFVAKGVLTARWPVGYPAFLGGLFALFGPSLVVGRLANAALYLGVIALAYALARRMFGSELAARLTALVLALYPNHIFYTTLLLSEILFLSLLLLGVALLLSARGGLALAGGLVFGAATLTKPQALFLPALLLGLRLAHNPHRETRRRRLGLLVGVHVAMAAVVAPWTMRNYRVFGRVVLVSTNGGYNLFIGNNPHARGYNKVTRKMRAMVRIWGRREGPENEIVHDDRARRFALRYMREHPLAVLALWPRKLFYTYRSDFESLFWHAKALDDEAEEQAQFGAPHEEVDVPKYLPHKIAAQACYMAVVLLAIGSAWVHFVRDRQRTRAEHPQASVGLWLFAYFTMVCLVFFGSTRFHFPVIPWLVIYAAALLARWLGPLHHGTARGT